EFAAGLDRRAARESISMGLPQVMGFNFQSVGYPHADAMFDAFASSEARQIFGFFDFVRSRAALSPLRGRQYTAFAEIYNGQGQAAVYGAIIQQRVELFAQLWQQRSAPTSRGIGPEEAPVPAPLSPPISGEQERVALRRGLARLLADQRRSLIFHQALLAVTILTILSGVVLAFVGTIGSALPPLLVGLAGLIAYAYVRPARQSPAFRAKIAELERLIGQSERLP
ncbi:MAG TPA: N-acetylmuramidase domain-containing protein, partial [Caldilineaceae bacterium]|nr:N-acetylmuramidase domain-containing protein [Caldilineaceae bacterium]